jgi:YggT family protein
VIDTLYLALRYLVITASAASALVALTHFLVRNGTLQPFGALPRFVRRTSDPVLKPIEHRLLRAGGNPQHSSLWLLALVALGGLALLGLFRWLVGFVLTVAYAGQAGWGAVLRQLVWWGFGLVMVALFIQVLSSWFGVSPYARWMRPVRFLSDWILLPIRRVMPPLGPLDLSPIVAYFALLVLRWAVLSILPG